MLSATECSGGATVCVAHHPPGKHRKECEHDRDRQRLANPPQTERHQAGTMNTGVPTSTWPNSHSADGIAMRMHPWDAE